MADVINRDTREIRTSVNTPDYLDPPWAERMDLRSWLAVPQRYRKMIGDVISEMSQAEKDVVDAADLVASRDATANELDNMEGVLRAFMLAVLGEVNQLRGLHALAPRTITQLKAVLLAKLGT